MLKLGMQIADVFPVTRADAADGIDIEVAIAAVRGEDFFPVRRRFPQKNGGKGFAVDALRHRAATEFDEGGQ